MNMIFVTLVMLIAAIPCAWAMGSTAEKQGAPSPAAAAAQTAETELLSIMTADGKRHDFRIEAVSTPEDMMKGLMFRTEMPADHGMLFMFREEGPRSFWMKNTFIPLDIVFIGSDGKIRNIGYGEPQNLQSVISDGDVLHVLEVNAGTMERLGIKPGDTVHHGAFGNELEQ